MQDAATQLAQIYGSAPWAESSLYEDMYAPTIGGIGFNEPVFQ